MSTDMSIAVEELKLWGAIESPDGSAAVGYVTLGAEAKQYLLKLLQEAEERGRSSVGDLAMEHACRADYFKPDTVVVMAETLNWASKRTNKKGKKS